jgi:hypothetical protein
MKITSTTDLEFPGLKFAIRQGEIKDLPVAAHNHPRVNPQTCAKWAHIACK